MRKTNARVILSKVTVLAYFKMKEKEDKKKERKRNQSASKII